jgi:hypothetical protein
VHDSDLRLFERRVELVDLGRLELELVEGERQLVGVDLPRAIARLQEPLALLAGEDLLDRRSSGSALRFVSGQTAPLSRRPSHGSYRCGGRQSLAQVCVRPAAHSSDIDSVRNLLVLAGLLYLAAFALTPRRAVRAA